MSLKMDDNIKQTGPCVGLNPGIQTGVGTYPPDANRLPLRYNYKLLSERCPIPKTGLTKRMREWMSDRAGTKPQRRFTLDQICEELDIPAGLERQKVAKALINFEGHGEIVVSPNKKCNRRQYLYRHDWHKVMRGSINRRIYKAMYVSANFAVSDLQRLTGLQERDWIDKLIRELEASGQVQQVGQQRCIHGKRNESIYHIVNRDKFKLEMLR